MDAPPVVVVDRQAETAGTAGDGLADPAGDVIGPVSGAWGRAPKDGRSPVMKASIALRASAAETSPAATSAAFQAVRCGPGGPSTIALASSLRAFLSLIGS